MRTIATTLLLVAVLGSVLTACGSATGGGQSAAGQSAVGQSPCDQAVAQAMAIDPGSDTVAGVGGAIAGCPSLEAWVAAAERYPDAFDGQDPTTLANELCGSEELANTPFCIDLRGR
ncbi:MAG: hypothetical protein QOD78_696 [Chloroflexota bacterium]|jgi:hypothetical protein|nr:hypothetical protein [Chloroflexota bacterium]